MGRVTVVPDGYAINEAMRESARRADIVIVSGGWGRQLLAAGPRPVAVGLCGWGRWRRAGGHLNVFMHFIDD